MNDYIKGRGAQDYHDNPFEQLTHSQRADFLEYCRLVQEEPHAVKTEYIPVFPKTIVNLVRSPDLPMAYSLNPYQGCEHGCVYCYARNSHNYWAMGAALDFEKKIMVKQKAPELLRKQLQKKNWKPSTVMLSGNTDAYQPAENRFKLTRQCLQVFLEHKHPVGIITKNALLLRDLDILQALAKEHLVSVYISLTTLQEPVRRLLEPRTASVKRRLKTIKTLSEAGIPVRAMLAPIIPALNSSELLPLAEAAANHGALDMGYSLVRLNGGIGAIFQEWVRAAMPDKAERILNQIKDCHGGKLNESRFGHRQRGEGPVAKQIQQMARLARKKYFPSPPETQINTSAFDPFPKRTTPPDEQLRLF